MHERNNPTRRRILGGLVASGAAMFAGSVLPGCNWSAASSNGTVELRFWNPFTGPDGRTMIGIVKRFNQDNPDIHVIVQRIEHDTYYNKLFVAGLGGRAPHVFVVHTDTLSRFARARFLRSTDDMVGPGGIPAEDFDPNVWQAVLHDGHHYAIPLDIHLQGMYYNRRLFEQAKVARPPTNRDEFLDCLRRVKNLNRPNTWGFVYTWMRLNIYTAMRQNGGDIFTPDHSTTTINSPACVEALQFCCDLISKDKLVAKPENTDMWIGFRQGNVAMCWHGIFMLPDLLSQPDLDWGAAPVPTLFKQPASWCNSHNLCMRADLAGAELEATKRFIHYLSDHSLDWAAGGQIPVRRSLRRSPRFAHMYAQSEFARQIPYAAYMPAVPFVFEYQSEFDLAIETALRGTESPQTVLDIAAKNIKAAIERYQNPTASRSWQSRPLPGPIHGDIT
jgi:multiple sugar transport system substrate-binding protein